KYRIYKNQRWWWWDYSSKGDYRKHYKNSLTTELLYEGNIDFKGNIAKIEYTPEQWGEYLIEIIPEDNNENHIATMFFGAYSWGSQAKVDEGVLESNYDNKTYKPGDIVSIPLNTPGKGRAWVSVENGNKILWEKWIDINKKDMEFDIRVTPDMIPNSYVFITLVQPQEQKNNDLPLRLYTIREIKVNSSERNIDYSINTDSVFKPGKDIRVNLKSDKKEKSLFTVSVVDEGSLGLTNYKTPSPYDYFYQKRALGVDTMDILKDVIQKDKGVIHKYFKTGGSDLGSEITKRSSPVMSKRVEPVTLFSGIKETDSNGEAIIDFKMPQYNGAVRIMVAGAYNNAFGRAEKTVPVKDKFIINPSMPMFLSPGDEFTALVQIISTEKNTKCDIYAVCDDKILNNNKKTQISLIKNKEYSHYFNFKANDIIGNSKIDIIIEDNKEKFVESINIPIRPDNSYSSDFKTNIIKKGKSQNIVFEQIGYENTVSKYLKLSSQLIPDFTNRFNNTVNYSYYSLNNIVSSAYALIETDISYTNLSEKDKTDKINKSIKEILKYQLFNGGFSRYQNNNEYDLFLTSFAGEFLNKAYNKGYYIPQKELELWKNFQKRQCINPEGDIRDRVFRVFVMAKSDVFEFGEMNILYQNSLNKIDNGLKVLLAYSYLKAGNLNTSNKILNSVYYKDIISNNSYFDKYAALAVLLEISLINNDEKISHELYKDIVKIFNSNKWLTDIEIIYCINSLNNYMQKYSVNDSFSADLFIENEKTSINNKKEFKTSIKSKINTVKIQNTGNSDLYWFSSWHGIPKTRSFESKSNGNMELSRGFYNNNGDIFDIKNTNQGDVFKIVIEVKNNNDKNLDNIVLNQIIPAGWEIINPSYNGGVLSGNYDNYTIRDDRVIWFFNLNSNERRSFEFNITSVIPGKFILPQAYCEVINKHGINAYSSSFYINVLKRQ
ncbi:MAG: hypothetical protein M0Q02_08630, partial [Candidatus Muirbacterium halophilum]|nr:hypothetical protein [Candidatus Muirbacterium halophilum]